MSTGNVIGGYKAAMKNPNVGEEAKEHAKEMVEKLEGSDERKDEVDTVESGGKNEGNVIGGYKATLKNPNVSEEAKEHAKEVLESKGVEVEES